MKVNVLRIITMLAWLGFSIWLIDAFMNGQASVSEEDSINENMQAWVLAISSAVFVWAGMLAPQPRNLLLIACGLLCYSFLVRELDVEELDIPVVFHWIGSGVGRLISLLLGFGTLIYLAARNGQFSVHFSDGINFAKSYPGLLIISAGVLLYVADFFEKAYHLNGHTFLEELVELCAYMLLLQAALASNAYIKRFDFSLKSSG